VIYGARSLTTALAPNLGVLLAGWSVLEGIGAALIMPAIVALVAGNFPPERRAAAYEMIAAAGAIAVAVGPLIGGAVTTFASWRWVFVSEAVIVIGILAALRKVGDAPPAGRVHFDLIGALLSVARPSLLVFGVLKSGTWGLVKPKSGGPQLLGTSPVVWLVIGGLLVIYGFFLWEAHVQRRGSEPLIRPPMLRNSQLAGGLSMFFSSSSSRPVCSSQFRCSCPWCSNCPPCRPACGYCRFRSPYWSLRWVSPNSRPQPGPA
jgi:MFS family permease